MSSLSRRPQRAMLVLALFAGSFAAPSMALAADPDTTAPTVPGAIRFIAQNTVGRADVRVDHRWRATDDTAVVRYEVQRSVNGGAWQAVTLPTPLTERMVPRLSYGTSYHFRVRAFDAANNASAWRTWATVTPTLYGQESFIIQYTGTWSRTDNRNLLNGWARYTGSSSRRALITFTGRAIAVVMTARPDGGAATIFHDGVGNTGISTRTPATQYRQPRAVFEYQNKATHTIEIVPSGNGRLEIDGVVVLR